MSNATPKRQAGLRAGHRRPVSARVQQGDSFYEAIAKHPRIFNRLYISMVKAGESGGLLAEILDRLAGFLEASARLRKKIKSAMTYPVIVICIAICITTFLIVRVVPVFGADIRRLRRKTSGPDAIPASTSATSSAATGITSLSASPASSSASGTFLRTKRGRETWDR